MAEPLWGRIIGAAWVHKQDGPLAKLACERKGTRMDGFGIFVLMVVVFLVFGGSWLYVERRKDRQREFWATLPPSPEPLLEAPECTQCGGQMTRGYLLDHAHAAYHTAQWLEGAPVSSGFGDRIRPRLDRSIPVTTFRCNRCGYLQNYARPELIEPIDRAKVKDGAFREL